MSYPCDNEFKYSVFLSCRKTMSQSNFKDQETACIMDYLVTNKVVPPPSWGCTSQIRLPGREKRGPFVNNQSTYKVMYAKHITFIWIHILFLPMWLILFFPYVHFSQSFINLILNWMSINIIHMAVAFPTNIYLTLFQILLYISFFAKYCLILIYSVWFIYLGSKLRK